MKPRKSLGQNFLHDQHHLNLIAEECVKPGLPIIEVGPGTGNLTKSILGKTDSQVTALEIDDRMQIFLDCIKAEYPNFDYQICDFFDSKLDVAGHLVCGNLPYNVGTKIILDLVQRRPPEMVFLLQEEVAKKIAAKPRSSDYGSLSVLVQAFYATKLLATVPPTAFTPVPRVFSKSISLRRLENDINFENLSKILRIAFSARRKVLRNTLGKAFPECGIDLSRRPEELSVAEYVNLANTLKPESPNQVVAQVLK